MFLHHAMCSCLLLNLSEESSAVLCIVRLVCWFAAVVSLMGLLKWRENPTGLEKYLRAFMQVDGEEVVKVSFCVSLLIDYFYDNWWNCTNADTFISVVSYNDILILCLYPGTVVIYHINADTKCMHVMVAELMKYQFQKLPSMYIAMIVTICPYSCCFV